jgi:serpin B
MRTSLLAIPAFAMLACSPKPPRPANLPEVRYEEDAPSVVLSAPVPPSAVTIAPPTPEAPAAVIPAVPQAEAAKAIGTVGERLTKHLFTGDENVVLSPWSVAELLAMASAGARGATHDAFSSFMKVNVPDDVLLPGFRDLRSKVAVGLSQATLTTTTQGPPFVLDVANSAWADDGVALEPAYSATIHEFFGAEVLRAPIRNRPDDARRKINAWVGDHTRQKINHLLAEGSVTREVRAVLVNAVYFLGEWESAFLRTRTSLAPFTTSTGSKTQALLMNQSLTAPYFEDERFQMIELGYRSSSLAMVIALPKQNVKQVDDGGIRAIQSAIPKCEARLVRLSLPKFSVTGAMQLSGALAQLGLSLPFTGKADFSAMTNDKSLYLSQVVHQALVTVDERGTEAAAATAGTFAVKSAVSHTVMKVDRPFWFLVRDRSSGAVFFAGRVVDPSKK